MRLPAGYLVLSNGSIIGPRGKALKASPARNGYPRISVSWGSRHKITFHHVHEVVCTYFHGPKPDWANCVRHLDNDKLNNDASNLRWGTWQDQYQDRLNAGTQHPVELARASQRC